VKPQDHASSVARTRRRRYDVHFDRDSPGVIAVEYVYTSRLVIRQVLYVYVIRPPGAVRLHHVYARLLYIYTRPPSPGPDGR
jgi:hypothetical protein